MLQEYKWHSQFWLCVLLLMAWVPTVKALGDEIGLMRGWLQPQQLESHSWSRNVELDRPNRSQLNYFHQLVWSDRVSRLQEFSKSYPLHPLINQRGDSGQAAVHLVQSPQMLRFLLEQGADPSITNHFDDTILLIMVQRNRYQMVKILLEFGADPSQVNAFGESPISEASWRRHKAIDGLLQRYMNRQEDQSSITSYSSDSREIAR